MLTFDEFGHLAPVQPIESDLTELEAVFVFNERRQWLFNGLKDFQNLLAGWYKGSFQIWVDGSFVTKKPFPKDVDIVVFIDFQWYEDKGNESLIHLLKGIPTVDAYFIPVFPENHPHFKLYNLDRIDWLFLFSRNRQKQKKGFLQLNF